MLHDETRLIQLWSTRLRCCRALSQRMAISGFLIFIAWTLGPSTSALAQSEEPVWGTPFNVSDSPDTSVNPAIVCDLFGNVHVFWSEKTQGEPREDPGHDVGDSIFYRRLRNGEWSSAIDIAFADRNAISLTQPTAVADNSGTLYLVWSSYRGIYFSSAPIASAMSAAAWSSPAWVVRLDPLASFSGPVKRPRLIVDEGRGSLHVIYSLYGTNGNLFYLRSPDLGQTWDEPRALTDVTLATSSMLVNANGRIILDRLGNMHVIWDYVVKEGEDWLGRAIKHTMSPDNGETWSEPTDIAVAWSEARWWGVADVVAASDKLNVVFVCGDRPRRCYTYSLDGGQTWTQPQQIFGDFQSLAGWDSMTVDLHDDVHLIAQLRDLNSQTYIWHATLGTVGWPVKPSRLPYDPALADHFPESCISLGNELHFVLVHESMGEVYHMSGQIYPTRIPALTLPALPRGGSYATTRPVPTTAVQATETPAPLQRVYVPHSPLTRQGISVSTVILISILPTSLLVLGAIVYRITRK